MLRLAPYDAKKVRGVLLTLAEAQRQRALYASLTPQQRALLPGMHSGGKTSFSPARASFYRLLSISTLIACAWWIVDCAMRWPLEMLD